MQPNGPPPANGNPRMSAELLATADAIRQTRNQLSRLVNESNPAIVGHADTTEVLVYGPRVSDALETIAGRLAIEQ